MRLHTRARPLPGAPPAQRRSGARLGHRLSVIIGERVNRVVAAFVAKAQPTGSEVRSYATWLIGGDGRVEVVEEAVVLLVDRNVKPEWPGIDREKLWIQAEA